VGASSSTTGSDGVNALKIAQIVGVLMLGIGIGIGFQPAGNFFWALLGGIVYAASRLTAWVKRDKDA
jgi:hypothetical protein